MKEITQETIDEMCTWYNNADNQLAREIAIRVEKTSMSVPTMYTKEQVFVQGVLFGYFLTKNGYID